MLKSLGMYILLQKIKRQLSIIEFSEGQHLCWDPEGLGRQNWEESSRWRQVGRTCLLSTGVCVGWRAMGDTGGGETHGNNNNNNQLLSIP